MEKWEGPEGGKGCHLSIECQDEYAANPETNSIKCPLSSCKYVPNEANLLSMPSYIVLVTPGF